ncbi:hypothetical protein NP233_g47 [Leucocoprinus birnbaumii]|uniref:DUF6534 domain-containing protein n=1 Tax=Leucocoprinus birnbaumii TaxID=56174 RepID=A0AAD5W4L9_9AGAR|nr:hypothetical protein NP233_g47 [Leucocoprinus birnbaumii]
MVPQQLPDNAPLILGPPLVGVVINWWLYGIFIMQYFMYINNVNRDPKWLRAVVHLLFLLDTVQSFMIMDDVFFWYVYNFGNYANVEFKYNLVPIDGILMDALIMFTVQLVYCWRLWVLGRWRILPGIAAFLSFVSCVSGIFVGIVDMIVDPVTQAGRYDPAAEIWIFASAVTDVLIAGAMAYQLVKYRTEHTSRTMIAIMRRILLLTLETNTVTGKPDRRTTPSIDQTGQWLTQPFSKLASLAIALLVSFLVPKLYNSNVYYAMYSNCFMVLLNQRVYYNQSRRTAENTHPSSSENREPASRSSTRGFSDTLNQNRDELSQIQFNKATSHGATVNSGDIELDDVSGIKGENPTRSALDS